MIRIKIDKNKAGEPVFKINIKEEQQKKYAFLKRALMEGKEIKGRYNYELCMKYFLPIFNNLDKSDVKIDAKSIDSFLEFSDYIDEKFYYSLIATPKFMRIWREENCPNIYKVCIDIDNLSVHKSIAFKQIKINSEL